MEGMAGIGKVRPRPVRSILGSARPGRCAVTAHAFSLSAGSAPQTLRQRAVPNDTINKIPERMSAALFQASDTFPNQGL